MKIALVNPGQKAVYGRLSGPIYPPLGLGYIASVLSENGHDVDIVDMDAGGLGREGFKKRILNERPRLVGFTCTTPLYYEVLNLAEIVKEETGAICVSGGIHPTVLPGEMLKDKAIDFAVIGEGERTILELVQILEKGGRLEDCPGISFRQNGKITTTPPRTLIDNLDLLPFPDKLLFNKFNYFYPDSRNSRCFPVITSRGCNGQCTFCCSEQIFSRRFRYRSVQNVADEVKELKEKFGAREIHIWDDNFTLLKRRVFEIRDELKKRDIKINFAFPNGLRVDHVDMSILQALKDMGTYSIAFGVESGSQKILDRACKGINTAQIKDAFKLCKKLGMETWAFFIIGLPGEEVSTIKDTIKFAKDIDPDVVKFHILKPYPGTRIYNELAEQKLIDDFNYVHFGIHTDPIHHLPGLSRDDIKKWHRISYRSFYLRPKILLRQIIRSGSFYRLRANLKVGLKLIRQMTGRN